MPSQVEFSLHFSGSDIFRQQELAAELINRTAANEHARLYAISAAASVVTNPVAALRLAQQAQATVQDPVGRGWALMAQCVADLSCEATAQRVAFTQEALDIAREHGIVEYVTTAYWLHLAALTELGRVAELDAALSELGPFLPHFPHLREGRHALRFRCVQAMLAGRMSAAEQLARQAYAAAEALRDPDAHTVLVSALAVIRWAQGRVVELEPAFLQARMNAPHEPIWAVALAWMWLRQGRLSAARALVTSLPSISSLPEDRNWLGAVCILADIAGELELRDLSAQIHEALVPYADRLITIGLGVTCWGVVARALGRAAIGFGDTAAAVAHYRHAIHIAANAGAHPWLAESQWELAALLAARGQVGDDTEALALATEAAATGLVLHLPGIEGPAANALAALRPPLSDPARPPATPRPRIAIMGDFKVFSTTGQVAPWQSRKARQLLKILVARRGAPVSRDTVMDILWPGEYPDRLINRLAVALAAVRKALDPTGNSPRGTFIENRDGLIRLRKNMVEIDVEEFLLEADSPPPDTIGERIAALEQTLARFTGEPLAEEHEELWAEELRRHVHLAYVRTVHSLADLYAHGGEHQQRLELYQRILSRDPYDQRAHEGTLDALAALGRPGQAREARQEYATRMRELGLSIQR